MKSFGYKEAQSQIAALEAKLQRSEKQIADHAKFTDKLDAERLEMIADLTAKLAEADKVIRTVSLIHAMTDDIDVIVQSARNYFRKDKA